MNISNLYTQALNQTADTSSISPLIAPSTTDTAPTSGAESTSTSISKPGQLFKELQNLSTSDPAKFKQVTSDIATQLKQAAQGATGSQAAFLNKMATKFATAAQTGDASGLTLKHAGHGHPHGHGHHKVKGNDGDGDDGSSATTVNNSQSPASQLMNIVTQTLANDGVSATSTAASKAASAYSANGVDPMSQVESIIGTALQNNGVTGASASGPTL